MIHRCGDRLIDNPDFGLDSAWDTPAEKLYKLTEGGWENVTNEPEDKGSHYRYSFKVKVKPEDLERGYAVANVDPYRICDIYEVGGGPLEHIAKKALRGTSKGHTEDDLIKELQCCLDRWKQMREEEVVDGE